MSNHEQAVTLDEIKTSNLLSSVLNNVAGETIYLGELITKFDRRSYGGIYLLLALLCLVPGISVFAGIVMIFPATQMVLGFSSPKFPTFIRDRQVSVHALQKWTAKSMPLMRRFEQIVKPRLIVLTSPLAQRLLGVLILVLALIVAIPFPFSNYPPAFAVMCFSLALLERDGLMIVIGGVISIAAIIFGYNVFYFLLSLLFA